MVRPSAYRQTAHRRRGISAEAVATVPGESEITPGGSVRKWTVRCRSGQNAGTLYLYDAEGRICAGKERDAESGNDYFGSGAEPLAPPNGRRMCRTRSRLRSSVRLRARAYNRSWSETIPTILRSSVLSTTGIRV